MTPNPSQAKPWHPARGTTGPGLDDLFAGCDRRPGPALTGPSGGLSRAHDRVRRLVTAEFLNDDRQLPRDRHTPANPNDRLTTAISFA